MAAASLIEQVLAKTGVGQIVSVVVGADTGCFFPSGPVSRCIRVAVRTFHWS